MKRYNFELAMGATISEHVVREIVTSVAEKQTGRKIKSIDIIQDKGVFAGYSVTFHADTSTKGIKPNREFIVENFGAEE